MNGHQPNVVFVGKGWPLNFGFDHNPDVDPRLVFTFLCTGRYAFLTIYFHSPGGDAAGALSDTVFYNEYSVTRGRQCNSLGRVCALWVLLLHLFSLPFGHRYDNIIFTYVCMCGLLLLGENEAVGSRFWIKKSRLIQSSGAVRERRQTVVGRSVMMNGFHVVVECCIRYWLTNAGAPLTLASVFEWSATFCRFPAIFARLPLCV